MLQGEKFWDLLHATVTAFKLDATAGDRILAFLGYV
jgi:hypothetical protein